MLAVLSTNSRKAVLSTRLPTATRKFAKGPRTAVIRCQRDEAVFTDRRAAVVLLGTCLLAPSSRPAMAAFGEGANVFGKVTNKSGFITYSGQNFAILVPSKWNPSSEREAPNIILRYADNFDSLNNFYIIARNSEKQSIKDYGTPEKFLDNLTNLLGYQTFTGDSISEGGFKPNTVSSASLLEMGEEKDKKGKPFYSYRILTRASDGGEGGRHQLFKATVSNGKLYILKVQAGDKRWFKGLEKDCRGVFDSFTVA